MSAETFTLVEEPDWQEGLPPAEFWIKAPELFLDPNEKIHTPTDARGLIKVDALIELVKTQIRPEYEWPRNLSLHHLYWPRSAYEVFDFRANRRGIPNFTSCLTPLDQCKEYPGISSVRRLPDLESDPYEAFDEWSWRDAGQVAMRFREQASNKVRLPRIFENVLHRVTLPPPIPPANVMRYYVEAWKAAGLLFMSVRRAARIERQSRQRLSAARDGVATLKLTEEQERVGEEIMGEAFMRHFRGIGRHLGTLSAIPVEYWPFSAEANCRAAAGSIGRTLLKGSQLCVRPIVQRPGIDIAT